MKSVEKYDWSSACEYDVTNLNSHSPANIFFLKDEALAEGYQVLQCSMFFTTEMTFLSDGIYIILERRLHHNHHEKKAFSSQLHKENNFATVVFPVPWPTIKRVNLLKSIEPYSESKSSPYKNIPLTVAQHFPARRRTLSCMYKNILLTVAQDFMAHCTQLIILSANFLLYFT